MQLVKIKNKFRVVIPRKIREKLPVQVGDILEAKVEDGKIMLTPKSVIDRGLDEALDELRSGRFKGPFDSAEELLKSLQSDAERIRPRSRRTAK